MPQKRQLNKQFSTEARRSALLALPRPWTSATRRAMAEGPPERRGRAPLSHLVVPWPASDQAYKGRSGGAAKPIRAIGDRQSHAARLSGELESARDSARAKLAGVSPDVVADGFALSVESWSDEPGYKLAVQSLDTSGAKLLSVMPGTDQWPERAVVWLPFGAVGAFFTKIEQFATETTSRGNPRNQALVANIADLRLAVLHDLLIHARRLEGELVVEASVRQVADRLRFVSKDTVHRRLRQLLSAGVLRRLHHEEVERFTRGVYAIDLTGTGVSVHRTHARR